MAKVLVTGATGNVGMATLKHLVGTGSKMEILAGVRNTQKSAAELSVFEDIRLIQFDFEDPGTWQAAFYQVDILFLLRPPHLANISKTFQPLLTAAREAGITRIVFISVQGADKSSWVPHHKIEALVREMRFQYIFLRPGYFMQNLTTTLYPDIQSYREIRLPSAHAVFNWIDVDDIGRVAAQTVLRFDEFANQAFDITGYENLSFGQVVAIINRTAGTAIKYRSVSILRFWLLKHKQGVKPAMILVMIILHFLPRFTSPPAISRAVEKITGTSPGRLEDFVLRVKSLFV